MKIELYLTPISLTKANLADKAVVVIDVLRCCTSISAALANGARGVIPTDGPGQAGEMWSKLGADLAILAGERDCNKIDNFQLGNSPSEFVNDFHRREGNYGSSSSRRQRAGGLTMGRLYPSR